MENAPIAHQARQWYAGSIAASEFPGKRWISAKADAGIAKKLAPAVCRAGTDRGLQCVYSAYHAKNQEKWLAVPTIVDVLSSDRFETYRNWACRDDTLAIRLYSFNVKLSAALYGPLHMLEVALRNVADRQLTTAHGANWPDAAVILKSGYQQGCVVKARTALRRDGKGATHSQLVAELNFGFWSSLAGRESHHLWSTLRPIFQEKGIQRSAIAQQLRDLRLLRNRIAHYEPVLALPLAERYASITNLTAWLSPSAAAWIKNFSDWQTLFPTTPILVPDPATRELRFAPAALAFLPV